MGLLDFRTGESDVSSRGGYLSESQEEFLQVVDSSLSSLGLALIHDVDIVTLKASPIIEAQLESLFIMNRKCTFILTLISYPSLLVF